MKGKSQVLVEFQGKFGTGNGLNGAFGEGCEIREFG